MSTVKPIAPGAVDLQDPGAQSPAPKYLKASNGRVFIATPALVKQYRKGKFGLVAISETELKQSDEYKEMAAAEQKGADLAAENEALKAKIAAMESEKAAETSGDTDEKPAAKKPGRPPKSATTE